MGRIVTALTPHRRALIWGLQHYWAALWPPSLDEESMDEGDIPTWTPLSRPEYVGPWNLLSKWA